MKRIIIIATLCLMGIGAMAQGKKEKAPQVPMYEVKSGIVTMEMDMMGQVIKQYVWVYKGVTLKTMD